jgi:prepilin-type N-terminal cleavage/methylation domain-containing protein
MKKGMTLTEILVVVGILGIIVVAITTFQKNVITNNKIANDSLSAIQDARTILRVMTKELRTASPSNNGAYPIAQAGTSTITFFSDSNGDGVKEQIRYYLTGMTLKKGSIVPTGSPLVYNSNNETFTTLAYNIKNATSTSLFEYFDSSYTGTSSPLTQPVTTTNVRLIKINLTIDSDPLRSPISRTYTSQITLRNIKDNL